MYCLDSIVEQNHRAAKQGWVEPGSVVGTSGVAPDLYDVYNNGVKVASAITYAQVVKNGYQNNQGYELVSVS